MSARPRGRPARRSACATTRSRLLKIDSHCHLDSEQFDADREAVIGRALDAGVEHVVAIGTGNGPPDLEAGIRLADRYPAFYATVGVHPHDAAKASPETFCGWPNSCDIPKSSPLERSASITITIFPLATFSATSFSNRCASRGDARKPIVIHTREAWADTIALLQRTLGSLGTRRHHALFFRAARAKPNRPGSRVSSELRRHCHVSQSSRHSGIRAPDPRGPNADRNRRPLSRPRSEARQTKRAGVHRRDRAEAGRSPRRNACHCLRNHRRQLPAPVFGATLNNSAWHSATSAVHSRLWRFSIWCATTWIWWSARSVSNPIASVDAVTYISQYLQSGGGKRLRPILVLLCGKLVRRRRTRRWCAWPRWWR